LGHLLDQRVTVPQRDHVRRRNPVAKSESLQGRHAPTRRDRVRQEHIINAVGGRLNQRPDTAAIIQGEISQLVHAYLLT